MTTESNEIDPRVSEAYRSIATETTPSELDREVLSMAAGSARSRYGLARAWIRPVAWAATIGLSLAFVLEMAQVRDVATPTADNDIAEQLEERIIRDEAPARAMEDNREQSETVKRSDAPAPLSKPAAKQVSSPPPATEPSPNAEAMPAAGSSVSADFEADDMTLLREAEEQARARSGSERSAASAAEALTFDAAVSFEAKEEEVQNCDQDARSSAATWYACIEELRATGLDEDAELELVSLRTEFPDFEEPQQNR